MLRSCRWCGRIHDAGYDCGRKPKRKRNLMVASSEAEAFRRTHKWKKKSLEIRDRDMNLCQVCLRNEYLASRTLTHVGLSVHHIVPVNEDPDRAMEDGNLITLCQFHHELAESGFIPREYLAGLAAATPPGP